jgi:hypothetical protein
MVLELKLVLKKIHWSLITKSLILGLVWFIFPYWFFLILSLFFYFIPIFRPFNLFFPFLIFIFVSKNIDLSFWNGLLIAILFFFILGIKDLIIIHRGLAYEFLGFLFFIIFTLNFFQKFNLGFGILNILIALLIALFYFLFFKNQIYFESEFGELNSKNFKIGLGIISFFIWQLILILNFLPLNFYLQSAILILFAVLAFEVILNYSFFGLNKQFLLANVLIFIILFILILMFNQWQL